MSNSPARSSMGLTHCRIYTQTPRPGRTKSQPRLVKDTVQSVGQSAVIFMTPGSACRGDADGYIIGCQSPLNCVGNQGECELSVFEDPVKEEKKIIKRGKEVEEMFRSGTPRRRNKRRCGKGFFSQSRLPVQTLLRCPYSPCLQ